MIGAPDGDSYGISETDRHHNHARKRRVMAYRSPRGNILTLVVQTKGHGLCYYFFIVEVKKSRPDAGIFESVSETG